MVTITARVIPKRTVLIPAVADRNYIVLETSSNYLNILRQYAAEHNMNSIKVTIEEQPDDWTERAKNFMFMVRDKLAAQQGDTSKENKDLLYQHAKLECGYHKTTGEVLSLKNLTRAGVSKVVDKLLDWCAEEGMDRQQFNEEREALRRLGEDERD